MEKSYYDIAVDNLNFLEANLASTQYNDLSVLAQQVTEKMLKSVLVLVCPEPSETLKSHHLKNIYLNIKESGTTLLVNTAGLVELKDIYFDARYPGKNYIDVSRESCEGYIKTMYDVVLAVNQYRKDNDLHYTPITAKSLTGSISESVNVDDIFTAYKNKFNIITEDQWETEIKRLTAVFETSDLDALASNIKETFL